MDGKGLVVCLDKICQPNNSDLMFISLLRKILEAVLTLLALHSGDMFSYRSPHVPIIRTLLLPKHSVFIREVSFGEMEHYMH